MIFSQRDMSDMNQVVASFEAMATVTDGLFTPFSLFENPETVPPGMEKFTMKKNIVFVQDWILDGRPEFERENAA